METSTYPGTLEIVSQRASVNDVKGSQEVQLKFNFTESVSKVYYAIQGFQAQYTNHNHYDFGNITIDVQSQDLSDDGKTATCNVTLYLRDNHDSSREFNAYANILAIGY